MDIYRHTQRSLLLFVIIIFVILFMVFLMYRYGFNWIGVIVMILIVFALYLFNSLTVRVIPGSIYIAFGPGLIRKVIYFKTIKSAEKVRNKWYYGFGIRFVPGGIMYNVAGLDAVELKLTNGRIFRIGTDEPDKLLEIIQTQIGIT